MNTSARIDTRSIVFLGFVAILLIVGALVAARSGASTSERSTSAPTASQDAAGGRYQRSDQPGFEMPTSGAQTASQDAAGGRYQRSDQLGFTTPSEGARTGELGVIGGR